MPRPSSPAPRPPLAPRARAPRRHAQEPKKEGTAPAQSPRQARLSGGNRKRTWAGGPAWDGTRRWRAVRVARRAVRTDKIHNGHQQLVQHAFLLARQAGIRSLLVKGPFGLFGVAHHTCTRARTHARTSLAQTLTSDMASASGMTCFASAALSVPRMHAPRRTRTAQRLRAGVAESRSGGTSAVTRK